MVLKVWSCRRSEDLAQILSWLRDRLNHDAEPCIDRLSYVDLAIALVGPTPTAYHARYSRVMRAVSQPVGKFVPPIEKRDDVMSPTAYSFGEFASANRDT
jgi:hypothetical protein